MLTNINLGVMRRVATGATHRIRTGKSRARDGQHVYTHLADWQSRGLVAKQDVRVMGPGIANPDHTNLV